MKERNASSLCEEERIRLDRQIRLPQIGLAGQEYLTRTSVLVVGAGGLGSPAAYYLTCAGIGRIGIMDADKVELSNLGRQILHHAGRLGMNKAQSAVKTLHALSPRTELIPYPFALDNGNAKEIFARYDLILDCTDNLRTKLCISDTCARLKKPFCYAGLSGLAGQVMLLSPPQTPCLRCLFGDIAPTNDEGHAPVLGAIAGIIGSLQALETVKFFACPDGSRTGKLYILDGMTLRTRNVTVPKNPHCLVCGGKG